MNVWDTLSLRIWRDYHLALQEVEAAVQRWHPIIAGGWPTSVLAFDWMTWLPCLPSPIFPPVPLEPQFPRTWGVGKTMRAWVVPPDPFLEDASYNAAYSISAPFVPLDPDRPLFPRADAVVEFPANPGVVACESCRTDGGVSLVDIGGVCSNCGVRNPDSLEDADLTVEYRRQPTSE